MNRRSEKGVGRFVEREAGAAIEDRIDVVSLGRYTASTRAGAHEESAEWSRRL